MSVLNQAPYGPLQPFAPQPGGSGGFQPGVVRQGPAFHRTASFLASQNVTLKQVGVTIDASLVPADPANYNRKIVKAGTLLTRVTATGKVGVYSAAATDGRQTITPDSGYLMESVDVFYGDVIAGVMLGGSVLSARVYPTPDGPTTSALAGRIIFQ